MTSDEKMLFVKSYQISVKTFTRTLNKTPKRL